MTARKKSDGEQVAGNVLDFDNLTPTQKTALSRALFRMAQAEVSTPTEPDLSGVSQFMITHDPDNVEVYRVEGEHLHDADGNKHDNRAHAGFTKSPVSDTRIGHAPIAYNGIPIETFEDHIGLRNGDSKTLAKFTRKHESEEVA